ncbi:MAG TPA: CapA family protein [Candidatus Limnocylindrales bacterium]|nr:CapA family protein [Candidatus Limnocylindrales bacterium]
MSLPAFTLWKAPEGASPVVYVAVCGDFLPAGNLALGGPGAWRERAALIAPLFDGVASTIVNLESTVGTAGLSPRKLNGLGTIVTAPDASLDYLEAIGAHAVGLANNHAYDFGPAGVRRTREAIANRGMVPLGAGFDLCASPEVSIWQGPRQIRVGYWAAGKAVSDAATRKSAGVEPARLDRGTEALEIMRRQGATCCIALLHAGCLRTNYPDPEDVRLLDGLAEGGFDIVAASHSHRISGARTIQRHNRRPAFCFYGLGSLVSGYIASPEEREGLIVVAGLDAHGALARVEVRPLLLAADGFARVPAAESSESILNRFRTISSEIENGSYEKLFYRDMSRGLMRLYLRDARRALHQSGVRGLARKAARLRMRHLRRLAHRIVG